MSSKPKLHFKQMCMFSNTQHINLCKLGLQPSSCSTYVAEMQKMAQSQLYHYTEYCSLAEFNSHPSWKLSKTVPLSGSICLVWELKLATNPNPIPYSSAFLNLGCKESSGMLIVKANSPQWLISLPTSHQICIMIHPSIYYIPPGLPSKD